MTSVMRENREKLDLCPAINNQGENWHHPLALGPHRLWLCHWDLAETQPAAMWVQEVMGVPRSRRPNTSARTSVVAQ